MERAIYCTYIQRYDVKDQLYNWSRCMKGSIQPKKKKKKDVWKVKKHLIMVKMAHLGSVWIPLITENWKHCSKIIFKLVNNTMWPIFNESLAEKRDLWVPWTVHETHAQNARCANIQRLRYPNVHLEHV